MTAEPITDAESGFDDYGPPTTPLVTVDAADAADVLATYWRGRRIPLEVVELAARSVQVLADAGFLTTSPPVASPPAAPPVTVPAASAPTGQAAAATLRAAAAGRRADADRDIGPLRSSPEGRARLWADAQLLDQAAAVVEGDVRPLFGWLPPDRWTDAMAAALSDAQPDTQLDTAPSAPPP